MREHDIAQLAAQAWASAHVSRNADPVEFGAKVGQVYQAALVSARGTDGGATVAALAALSVPAEMWQSLERLSLLVRRPPTRPAEERLSGAEA